MQPLRLQDPSQLWSRPGPAPPPPARGLDAASRSDIEGLIGSVTSQSLDSHYWDVPALDLWWMFLSNVLYLQAVWWFFGLNRNMKYLNPHSPHFVLFPLVHPNSWPSPESLLLKSEFTWLKKNVASLCSFQMSPRRSSSTDVNGEAEQPDETVEGLSLLVFWWTQCSCFLGPIWNSIWKALELQLGFSDDESPIDQSPFFPHKCDIQAFKNIFLKQSLGIRQLLGGCEAWSLAKIASQKRSSETLREKRKSVCVIILSWRVYSVHWLKLNP